MKIYTYVLLLLLTSVTGCRRSDVIELSTKNQVTIGALDVMITINPLLTADASSIAIHDEVWQSLNQLDPKTCQLMPVLASLPEISEDQCTYSYVMNGRARWSDNTFVKTEDVIFTFKSIINQTAHADEYREIFQDLDSVWSPQPSVIMFQYNKIKINRAFDIAEILILPKHTFDSSGITDLVTWTELHASKTSDAVSQAGEIFYGTEKSNDLKRFVGSGPYVFDEWEHGQIVKLHKNPNYWAQNIPGLEAYPERLIYYKIADDNARVVALKSQNVDLISVSSKDYLHAFDSVKYSYIKKDTIYDVNYSSIMWNNSSPLFNSKRIRKALTMLFNRDAMIKIIYDGLAKKVEGPVSDLQPGWDPSLHQPEYNPLAAKKILEEEGWADSDGDGILDKLINGQRIPFKFTFLATSKLPLLLMVIEELRKVGIEANLTVLDFAVVLENIRERKYDAYRAIISGSPSEPDLFEQYCSEGLKAQSNRYCYSNPVADSIMKMIKIEVNRDRRLTLIKKLQQIIVDDQPETYLFSTPKRFAWLDRFNNVLSTRYRIDPRYFIVRNSYQSQ